MHYSGEAGSVFRILQHTYQISPESPEFYGRYYKQTFWSIFSGHSVYTPSWTFFVLPLDRDSIIIGSTEMAQNVPLTVSTQI